MFIAASPPQAVSSIVSAGVLSLVIDELTPILDVADYFETYRSGLNIELTIHGLGHNEVAPTRALVAQVFEREPELEGWEWSVADQDDEVPLVGQKLTDDEPVESGATHESPGPDISEQFAELLATDTRMRQLAERFGALDLHALIGAEDGTEDGVSISDVDRLAGLLVSAAVVMQDQLFDDLAVLEDDPAHANGLWSFGSLPDRFSKNYTIGFLRCLIVVAANMADQIQTGWVHPRCVAEELCTRLWLDLAQVTAEGFGLPLPTNWRDDLEDTLFEDGDHELLYDPAYDGFENEEDFLDLGMAPMTFDQWFTAFRTTDPVPLYVQDLPAD